MSSNLITPSNNTSITYNNSNGTSISNTSQEYNEHSLEETQAALRFGRCGTPNPHSFHLLRPASDPELPWPGLLFGMVIDSLMYWCTDQLIVQRSIAARSITHAKLGCIFAAALKLTPLFLMVFPGMLLFVFLQSRLSIPLGLTMFPLLSTTVANLIVYQLS